MIQVSDTNPIFLSCHVSENMLALSYNDAQLGDQLEIYFVNVSEATIALTDFEHEGERIRIHAFTIGAGGALEPWERTAEGVSSPPLTADKVAAVLHFTALAVAYEPAGDPSADDLDTFEPVTWQAKIRVDVPPKGSKPV